MSTREAVSVGLADFNPLWLHLNGRLPCWDRELYRASSFQVCPSCKRTLKLRSPNSVETVNVIIYSSSSSSSSTFSSLSICLCPLSLFAVQISSVRWMELVATQNSGAQRYHQFSLSHSHLFFSLHFTSMASSSPQEKDPLLMGNFFF